MIAFMPYKRKKLTSYSLAAAIVPLFNAGFSRLIIVGIQDNDHEYTREACVLLQSINYKMRMEIAHVQILNMEWVKGEKAPGRKRVDTKSNIPRGAVIGMQNALMGKLDSNKERTEWLGKIHDVDYWKYIYLTEPDTILNLNHDLLPLFRTALDDGISLFPHRLHPLPHETDLPTNTTFNRGLYLPDYPPFSNVTTLDPLGDDYISCCDDGLSAPGKENWTMQRKGTNDLNNICSSNKRWWECGFNEYDNNSIEEFNMTKIIQGHVRLLSYRMMRLQNGIGAVFGTNNQGRQCIPSKTSCDDNNEQQQIKEPKIKR
ncbi:hypothetical protein FRACYDRAFT_235314 [Fragilariopsis cylindrus CCMP1102]|uniref:Uncharacterized protein n=1 Tax=Fragilariopsis cylindrus CCMP1102 TaxID=635003 RepID=A0A1E7FMA6_9STRA|nr:hypothetical protein FRACYDRAFT_235314 [Fragilariopsis cylindrus CCMP1102]|eukprot:OEU19264.1 hypothetical protein FRACYDRAFT_235314 [Fragilariopsis cylindrus CCMP1102]